MNNASFFYQDGGKAVGPVTMTDLRGRIKDGKVRLFDLILREGDESWRMALEHVEFKEDFKDKSKSAMKERPWVCLQRKNAEGFDFVTTGPFSHEEIRESLMAGKIAYTDYVWRSGFKEWKRIGLLEDFNPRLRRMEVQDQVSEIDSAELVKNVVELKRPRPPLPELPPDEATTRDLTKKSNYREPEPPPPVPEKIAPNSVRLTPVDAKTEVKAKRRRKNVPWLDWGIVAILVVVLGAVALVLSRNIKRARTLEVPATTVVETLPPQPTAPLNYEASEQEQNVPEPADDEPKDLDEEEPPPPVAVAKAPPPKKIPPKAPTELFLSVQNRSNSQARVELRTNGSREFPVYVQVVGVPGQVTSGPSFYKYLRLKPTGDPRQPLDLSKVKLPQGRLIFRATTEGLRKEAKLNLGVTDPAFKQSIGRVRKLHAYAIWSERLQLMKLSSLLETRVAQAVAGQKFNPKGLEAVDQVRLVNGYKYALFDDWYELKTAMVEAKRQPTTTVITKVKRVHDKMVAYTVWK